MKKPEAPIAHGVPTSVGRRSPVISAISDASSRAAGLPELTISPSTRAMSMPRPSKWLETEPPEVNCAWPVLITDSSILCFSASLPSSPIIRGSTAPSRMSFCASASSTRFLFCSSASAASPPPPDPAAASTAAGAAGCAAAASGVATGAAAARLRAVVVRRGRGRRARPRPCRPPRRAAAATGPSGTSLASGRSFDSSLIFATASSTASARLASGDSAAAIFAAALSAAACSGGTVFSAAAPFAVRLGLRRGLLGRRGLGRGLGRRRGRAPRPRRAAASPAPFGAGLGRRRRRRRVRPARERALEGDRRQRHAAQHVADRARHVVDVGEDVLAELVDADALHRGGHHHPGQARLRLALVERHHRLAGADRHLVRELVEARLAARARRVPAELRAELRVAEQPLDQLGRDVGFGGRHVSLRASCPRAA